MNADIKDRDNTILSRTVDGRNVLVQALKHFIQQEKGVGHAATEIKEKALRKSVFELSGAELDYAVSRAAGLRCELKSPDKCTFCGSDELFEPSVNWTQGGPIIEMARLRIEPPSRGMRLWSVSVPGHPTGANEWGTTLLEAAMRCFVATRLGEEVFIQPVMPHQASHTSNIIGEQD